MTPTILLSLAALVTGFALGIMTEARRTLRIVQVERSRILGQGHSHRFANGVSAMAAAVARRVGK